MPATSLHAASGQTTWLSKFIATFFAMLVAINIVLMLSNLFPTQLLNWLNRLFQYNIVAIHIWPSLILGLLFSIYWQRRERKETNCTLVLQPLFYGLTRYWLSFEISAYGFAKLLQTQFAHSFQNEDTLTGSLNGFNLTWYFFSYSYPFSVIIGLLQIGGSILLLFRRTVLPGVTILLPILFNILLINIFYRIAAGAFFNSVLFCAGLLYLLLLRWNDLKKIFLKTTDSIPPLNWNKLIFILKLLPIIAAYLLILNFALKNQPSIITGKWKVDTMIRGNDTVKQEHWINDRRIWSNIYLERDGQVSISANPYMFDNTYSHHGTYTYDSAGKNIRMILWDQQDTFNLKVINIDDKQMQWRGMMRNDSTVIFLSKAKQERVRDNW